MSDTHPFVRSNFVDKPGTLGAVWWNKSLAESSTLQSRRGALGVGLAVGLGLVATGLVAGAGAGGSYGGDDDGDGEPLREELRRGLELQETYGWNFGATTGSLVYDGQDVKPFDRAALRTLAADLAPAQAGLEPFFVSALFRSPEALPKLKLGASDAPVAPIADALRTGLLPSMTAAFETGKALAQLLALSPEPTALVVDLEGRDAVAFAAGALDRYEPVFQFDNWPHPRGVVSSHRALAAAVYYQPLFAKKQQRSPSNQPAFVLDRGRLAPYRDDTSQFDNRWLARLPPAGTLKGFGAKRVLYVVDGLPSPVDVDDLNELFVAYEQGGLPVRAVSLHAFDALEPPKPTRGYARSAAPEPFFAHYPFRPGGRSGNEAAKPALTEWPSMTLRSWRPAARPALFGGATTTKPALGLIPVLIGVTTGALAGAKLAGLRSGSILRASGGWGGG